MEEDVVREEIIFSKEEMLFLNVLLNKEADNRIISRDELQSLLDAKCFRGYS